MRPAFSLITKVLDDFTSQFPQSTFSDPSAISFSLDQYIRRYQDPTQADTIMKVQQELDETKVILVSLYLASRHQLWSVLILMAVATLAQDHRISPRAW
jgi:hypothetical protein